MLAVWLLTLSVVRSVSLAVVVHSLTLTAVHLLTLVLEVCSLTQMVVRSLTLTVVVHSLTLKWWCIHRH